MISNFFKWVWSGTSAVYRDGTEGRKRQGNGGEGGGGDNDKEGEDRDVSGAKGDGVGQMDEGCGPCPVDVPGGEACGGSNVAECGPDSQEEEGLPGN